MTNASIIKRVRKYMLDECSNCSWRDNCEWWMNETIYFNRYIAIRHDGVMCQDTCPDFSHITNPRHSMKRTLKEDNKGGIE